MIDERQLRIGNWLQYAGGKKPYMVTLERFWEDYKTADAFYYLEPIPLTPEVLGKCGFVTNDTYWYNDTPIGVNENMTAFITTVSDSGGVYMELPHITQLHQLQNLTYLITGTELNYQP